MPQRLRLALVPRLEAESTAAPFLDFGLVSFLRRPLLDGRPVVLLPLLATSANEDVIIVGHCGVGKAAGNRVQDARPRRSVLEAEVIPLKGVVRGDIVEPDTGRTVSIFR